MELDRTDVRIVALLEQNARLPAAAIGREIGLSRTAVQDRIAKLERAGVIEGYRVVLSSKVSGPIKALLFIKIADRPCQPVLDWLQSLPGVQSLCSLAGELDAVASVNVASLEDLSHLNDVVGKDRRITNSTSQIILQRL